MQYSFLPTQVSILKSFVHIKEKPSQSLGIILVEQYSYEIEYLPRVDTSGCISYILIIINYEEWIVGWFGGFMFVHLKLLEMCTIAGATSLDMQYIYMYMTITTIYPAKVCILTN